MHILDNYLVKDAIQSCGLTKRQGQITISEDAKHNIIR